MNSQETFGEIEAFISLCILQYCGSTLLTARDLKPVISRIYGTPERRSGFSSGSSRSDTTIVERLQSGKDEDHSIFIYLQAKIHKKQNDTSPLKTIHQQKSIHISPFRNSEGFDRCSRGTHGKYQVHSTIRNPSFHFFKIFLGGDSYV